MILMEWDINEKKNDVLIWIYEYWIWFHRYSPPSLFSPSFSHIWWDTLSRRDHFRKQFVATLDSDGWACPIDLRHSLNCLFVRVLKTRRWGFGRNWESGLGGRRLNAAEKQFFLCFVRRQGILLERRVSRIT